MIVTLLYLPDCPHWRIAEERLVEIAAQDQDVTLSRVVIDTHGDAMAAGFRGSPTIHVDGTDPFADPTAPVELACRLYPTPDGYAGSPTLEQLRDAVGRARRPRRAVDDRPR